MSTKPQITPSSITPKQRQRAQLLAFGFFSVGVPGLILPFIQGIAFILIGLFLLSYTSKNVHDKLSALQARFPRLKKPMAYADRQARRWL